MMRLQLRGTDGAAYRRGGELTQRMPGHLGCCGSEFLRPFDRGRLAADRAGLDHVAVAIRPERVLGSAPAPRFAFRSGRRAPPLGHQPRMPRLPLVNAASIFSSSDAARSTCALRRVARLMFSSRSAFASGVKGSGGGFTPTRAPCKMPGTSNGDGRGSLVPTNAGSDGWIRLRSGLPAAANSARSSLDNFRSFPIDETASCAATILFSASWAGLSLALDENTGRGCL